MKMMTLLGLVLLTALSCTSTKPASPPPGEAGPVATPAQEINGFFMGSGQDASMLAAMNKSKMDAVKKAVIILVGGEDKERLYMDIIGPRIYQTNNPNQFVEMSTFERLRNDKAGEIFVFEAKMKLKIDVIRNALVANNVPLAGGGPASTGPATGPSTTPANPPASTRPTTANLEIQEGDYEAATEDEARKIRRLVDNLTYMVYFPETSTVDPAVLRELAAKANEYLAANTIEYIELDVIERTKADQRRVFEDQSGSELTLTQWVAQSLNADVYIEVSATLTETVNNRNQFLARGGFEAKLYDPSTGKGLGTVSFNQLNASMSPASIDLARTNLIQNTVKMELMPRVIQQSKGYMVRVLERGIRYDVIFQQTADSRLMAQFRRALQRRVKSLNVVNSTAEESKYELFYIGNAAELEEEIYKAAEAVPGMEGIYNVMIRGKNLTFNTGL